MLCMFVERPAFRPSGARHHAVILSGVRREPNAVEGPLSNRYHHDLSREFRRCLSALTHKVECSFGSPYAATSKGSFDFSAAFAAPRLRMIGTKETLRVHLTQFPAAFSTPTKSSITALRNRSGGNKPCPRMKSWYFFWLNFEPSVPSTSLRKATSFVKP